VPRNLAALMVLVTSAAVQTTRPASPAPLDGYHSAETPAEIKLNSLLTTKDHNMSAYLINDPSKSDIRRYDQFFTRELQRAATRIFKDSQKDCRDSNAIGICGLDGDPLFCNNFGAYDSDRVKYRTLRLTSDKVIISTVDSYVLDRTPVVQKLAIYELVYSQTQRLWKLNGIGCINTSDGKPLSFNIDLSKIPLANLQQK
jgi:hypothetical protein